MSEYAPGIPNKETSHGLPRIEEPRTWEFAIHDHDAERRGRHFDLRLGDPTTGHAHSWAMTTKWPAPGEKTWAIAQPTHTVGYMDFEGRIESGYGKGDVKLHDRAKTEVMNARDGHVSFNLYRSTGPEEYTLHRVSDKKWILANRTLHRDKHEQLPMDKPAYKETKTDDPRLFSDDYLLSAKIDDAHNLFYFPAAGERVRAVSYRPGKRALGGIIEHTHKVPGLDKGVPTPAALGGTILRGGLYALHPGTGKAAPAKDIGGMLNADVWKSREKQKEHGELIPVLYDVVQFRGKKMEGASYEKKLEVLKHVEKLLPNIFHLPRMARTKEEKKELIEKMRSGEIPETAEGVVAWHRFTGAPPIKAKFTKEHDVYIRDFFPGQGKYKGNGVGGFLYSHTSEGPIVGKVGTGLSDAQRRDMHKRPDAYLGTVARVKAQDKFPSGALRAPAFQGFHLDKNTPEQLSTVKLASADGLELVFFWDV